MIWKNFLRELISTTSRLISVIIITAVAVMMMVGFNSLTYNLTNSIEDYYDKQNVADFWISGMGFNKTDCYKISELESIEDIQPRIVFDAESRYNSEITLEIFAVPDEININIPYIVEGDFPKDNRSMMLSSEFAKKHGLEIGDDYEFRIKGTNVTYKMKICALIKDPECSFHINSSTLVPDFYKYGFAYINEECVNDLYGTNVYNQICITLKGNADESNVKKSINEILGTRVINILSLDDNINASNLYNLMESLKLILMVFPLMFFLIAALIMFSTMSRLIENARNSIGTFKALGYYDRTIFMYYLSYAIIVVALGYMFGVLPSKKPFTDLLVKFFLINVDMPYYSLSLSPIAMVASLLITIVACIGTAYYITSKVLAESPAQCMRPKPPKKVKKILPERIPFLWKRIGFNAKYVLRNMFRNKGRMAICIVGISGCMTLILTAFIIFDSIQNYIFLMKEKQHKYDIVVHLKNDITPSQYKRFSALNDVTDTQYEMQTGVKIYSSDNVEITYLTVTEDTLRLKNIDVYDYGNINVPHEGIIIDKKVSEKLNVTTGENVRIKFVGDNKYYDVSIADIINGIDGAYISKTAWRDIGKGYTPTTVYLNTTEKKALGKLLDNYDFVSSYSEKEKVTKAIGDQMSSMVSIVFILILFGGLLAVVVLYNLGTMSFFEQIRNLATLMVLGFYDKETKKLLLTENIVFSFAGSIVGIPLGIKLSSVIMSSIDSPHIELTVKFIYIIISVLFTLIFTILVNKILSNKMKTIDMLGALKSIE